MHFKAAIFDMDGTLVDSLMIWDVMWERFGEKYLNDPAFRPSDADDKAVRTLTLKDAMELIHAHYHIAQSGAALLEETNKMLVSFYSSQVQLKKGVKEFLEHCYHSGTKLCVASATERTLVDMAMEHCGLNKYFSKVFSCADLGVGKDRPDIYLTAQKFLGVPIAETWVFEDSAVAVDTASKIGMKTVGIFDRYNFDQEKIAKTATVYIADGEDLSKLI